MHHLAARLPTWLTIAALAVVAVPARAEEEPFGRLSVNQVEALLGQPDVRIFDVNDETVYAKGHVPGALRSDLTEVVSRLPADKGLRLVFYCKNGH
jgi:hypothetical protein